MSREEIVKQLVIKYSIPVNAAYEIWDAAIEAAAESATLKYRVVTNDHTVDKQSIIDLKFNK